MTIVSLLDELVNALLKAEGTFLDNPKVLLTVGFVRNQSEIFVR